MTAMFFREERRIQEAAPAAPVSSLLFGEGYKAAGETGVMRNGKTGMRKRLGIYVHIPFCVKKCNYCDFLSAPAGLEQMECYLRALREEIKGCREFAFSYTVQSIFFGGGTPTLPPAEWIVGVLEELKKIFIIEETAEITIECNPETVNEEKLRLYHNAGFNRISFGLQSADNEELRRLGRVHTYEKFLEGFFAAREAGFINCNIDLMSALPNQTLVSWENTVRKVIALKPEHISAYSLIIEEGTAFYEMKEKGLLSLPDEEEERKMYERTEEYLREAGYYRYEISNYAKPGLESRHNLIYWTGQEYLGIGLGASSYIEETRFHNTSRLEEYLKEAEEPERLRRDVEKLTLENRMEEFMFLGLRKMTGVSKTEFKDKFHCSAEEIYGKVIEKWKRQGLLAEQGDRIYLTHRGIDVSNVVLAEFLLMD